MKKSMITTMTLACLLMCSGTVFSRDVMSEKYFSVNTSAPLSKYDLKSLKVVRQHNSNIVDAVAGEDGSVQFAFGGAQPTIICAPLQVTDIALQVGEKINSLQIGDSARWILEPMISGEGNQERIHIVVKPNDIGLDTNLIVATNKRVYNIRLKSTKTQYLPRVTFSYPEVEQARWQQAMVTKQQERERSTIPETKEYLADLDFGYEVEGTARWKPIRVYNDGHKMIIELPKWAVNEEVPTLLALRKEEGVFTDEESELVNYRLQGNRFIVDQIPERVILITGVGRAQSRITITHLTGR